MSVLNIRAKHNIANYDLQLPVDATIKDLSEKILELTGVPISGQKIIFCGKQLPKDLAQLLTEVRSWSDHQKRKVSASHSGRTRSSRGQQDHGPGWVAVILFFSYNLKFTLFKFMSKNLLMFDWRLFIVKVRDMTRPLMRATRQFWVWKPELLPVRRKFWRLRRNSMILKEDILTRIFTKKHQNPYRKEWKVSMKSCRNFWRVWTAFNWLRTN